VAFGIACGALAEASVASGAGNQRGREVVDARNRTTTTALVLLLTLLSGRLALGGAIHVHVIATSANTLAAHLDTADARGRGLLVLRLKATRAATLQRILASSVLADALGMALASHILRLNQIALLVAGLMANKTAVHTLAESEVAVGI